MIRVINNSLRIYRLRVLAIFFAIALFAIAVLNACAPSLSGKHYLGVEPNEKSVGLYVDEPKEIRSLKEMPDILGWYETWYAETADTKLKLCGYDHKAVPLITWQPTDISLAEIAEGKHDAYIRKYLTRIGKYCKYNDVLIRFAHEMELRPSMKDLAWYSWQNQDPTDYIAAWIHIVEIGRELVPTAKWVWSPNRADEFSALYYPGDEYVDYVSLSINLKDTTAQEYPDFESFYTQRAKKEILETYGKPIIISEVAYDGHDKEAKMSYLRSIFSYFEQDDKMFAVVFFNTNADDTRMYKITDDEDYMNIFYEGLREAHALRRQEN